MNVFYSIPDAHLCRFLVLICLIFGRISSITLWWSQNVFSTFIHPSEQQEKKENHWHHHSRDGAHGGWKKSKGNLLKNVRLFRLLFFVISPPVAVATVFCLSHFISVRTNEWTKIHTHGIDSIVSVGVMCVCVLCVSVLSFTDHRFSLEFVEQQDYRVKNILAWCVRHPDVISTIRV